MTPEQANELLQLQRATLEKAAEYDAGLFTLEMLLKVQQRLRKLRDSLEDSRQFRRRTVRKHGAAKLRALGLIR